MKTIITVMLILMLFMATIFISFNLGKASVNTNSLKLTRCEINLNRCNMDLHGTQWYLDNVDMNASNTTNNKPQQNI